MLQCLHCYISGKVQGVWYRDTTRQVAQKLQITGYARNLDDGRVEVLACGEQDALDAFKEWFWQGPQLAKVTDVECYGIEPESLPNRFTIAL